eukprot:Phypoly_transcript_02185.p1 GENE.Phypoly_transcript_02185~~Phypoly_transcript_02185.p1  ORF type:complete len:940 (-),score=130.13 Phypoly_transcript_02185:39-2858(-)
MTTHTSTSPPFRNTPSPANVLGSSTQELFDSGTFQTDNAFPHYDPAFVRPCGYARGIRLKVQAEFGLSDHSAVLHEENMYIYGGVSVDNNLNPTIQVFNFVSRSFSTITPSRAPIPRYQHSAIVSDGHMIVFGGGAENVFLNDLVAYSFETQTWSEIIPATDARPSPRRGHTCTLVGRVVYVFGGYGSNGPVNDMYKFDLDQKIWAPVDTKGPVPQPRFLHTACCHKKSIWFFGGTNIEFVFGDLFRFDCDTNTWEEIPSSEPPPPSPRCSHTCVVSNAGELIVIGGATDNDSVIDAYAFNIETRKWFRLELSTPGVSRQGHSAVLRGESVFLFGGIVGSNHAQLDLLSLNNKDSFEGDDIYPEADEEVSRQQALPRPMWEAILLKKHPDILQYRELTRRLTGVNSYGRARNCAATEDPAHMNHELVLNLVVECLHVLGCSRSANAIVEESRVPYFPLNLQHTDSRLVTMLKLLKPRTKPKNIFDAEFSVTSARVPDSVDPEVELVDHMVGAGRNDQLDNEDDIDIWLEPEDTRKNIVRTTDESGKPVIRAANLNKLVQALTYDRDKAPDPHYLKMFFYTYQSFTSPQMLLKKLIQKYHVRVEKGVVVDDKFKAEVIEPVQTRVCRVLKFWIEQCPWDFNGPTSEKLLNSLNAFIDGPLSRDSNFTLVKQLRNSITKTMKKKHAAEDDKPHAALNPPEPKVPRNVFSSSLILKNVDEVEIARQLTLLEFHQFAAITPNEFLNKGWEDPNPKKSTHIKELRTRAVDIARWVALTILKADSKRARAKLLERFIRTADQLRQIKNYQTMNSIILGYCHPSITRLGQTFNEISPRAKELYPELVQFAKNEHVHRETMKTAPVPCIPNMELALHELAHFHDTTPDHLNNLVHFQKRIQLYHHITKFQAFQQRSFNFQPVHQIISLFKFPKITDKELEELSRKAE